MSNLKVLRTKSGLTQKQIAIHVGSSTEAISQIENGVKNPSLIMAQKITAALVDFGANCSVDDVFPYKKAS
jgi:putative transcriptional regulator